jgi:hypothetical protein
MKETTMKAIICTAVMLAASGALPSAGHAQDTADAATCWRRIGDLGINGLSGSMRMARQDDGTMHTRFFTEPEVLTVSGPAAATLRAGDVLVAVDALAITTPAGGIRFSTVAPGETVALAFRRDGRVRTTTMTAGSRCVRRPRQAEAVGVGAGVGRGLSRALDAVPPEVYLGFSFRCADCGLRTEGDSARWFFSAPLAVTDVHRGSPAWQVGLRPGDEIVSVAGHAVGSAAAGGAFTRLRPGERVAIGWRRPDGSAHDGRLVPGAPRTGPSGVGGGAGTAGEGALRYTGVLDRVAIEVRGRPVIVPRDEGTGEVTIQAEGLVVTLRRLAGER